MYSSWLFRNLWIHFRKFRNICYIFLRNLQCGRKSYFYSVGGNPVITVWQETQFSECDRKPCLLECGRKPVLAEWQETLFLQSDRDFPAQTAYIIHLQITSLFMDKNYFASFSKLTEIFAFLSHSALST